MARMLVIKDMLRVILDGEAHGIHKHNTVNKVQTASAKFLAKSVNVF